MVATSPQFFTSVAGWAVAALRRLPFVFELRDLWPASISAVGALQARKALPWLERLELFLYRRATKVVALTAAFKHDLVSRGILAEHVEVVLNGFDFARYAPQPRDMDLTQQLGLKGCFTVGYIGTHGMAHALDRVLDAAALLQDTPAIRFLFVGAGATRDALIAQAAREHLDNVIFVSSPTEDSYASLLECLRSSVGASEEHPIVYDRDPFKDLRSHGDGACDSARGAGGRGLPIVRDTGAGIVVPPECPTAMAQAIRELYHDKACSRRERSTPSALRLTSAGNSKHTISCTSLSKSSLRRPGKTKMARSERIEQPR